MNIYPFVYLSTSALFILIWNNESMRARWCHWPLSLIHSKNTPWPMAARKMEQPTKNLLFKTRRERSHWKLELWDVEASSTVLILWFRAALTLWYLSAHANEYMFKLRCRAPGESLLVFTTVWFTPVAIVYIEIQAKSDLGRLTSEDWAGRSKSRLKPRFRTSANFIANSNNLLAHHISQNSQSPTCCSKKTRTASIVFCKQFNSGGVCGQLNQVE